MKQLIRTIPLLVIVLAAGCNTGDGASSGPEPGDTCSILDELICSANGLYVLRCEEDTSGELHWFIHDECEADSQETCMEGECECSESLCQGHCLDMGMDGECMGDCSCTTCNESACRGLWSELVGYMGECSGDGNYCAMVCDPSGCPTLCTGTGGTTGTCNDERQCECDNCDYELCATFCDEQTPGGGYGMCEYFGCVCY